MSDIDFDDIDFDDEDSRKKVYFKTLITFPETGQSINPSFIQTIEKTFKICEVTCKLKYGILINRGIDSGVNSPKADIEVWYDNEDFRDQRYDKVMKVLDEVGIKIIQI